MAKMKYHASLDYVAMAMKQAMLGNMERASKALVHAAAQVDASSGLAVLEHSNARAFEPIQANITAAKKAKAAAAKKVVKAAAEDEDDWDESLFDGEDTDVDASADDETEVADDPEADSADSDEDDGVVDDEEPFTANVTASAKRLHAALQAMSK